MRKRHLLIGPARRMATGLILLCGLAACGNSAAPVASQLPPSVPDALTGPYKADPAPPPLCVPPPGTGTTSIPNIVGPLESAVPGDAQRRYAWAASVDHLAERGFVEEEFFFCGRIGTGDYTTRMIVRRPKDAARFNGTVLVEWLNVSDGVDQDLYWLRSHEHLLRSGTAWVGVSVQTGGLYSAPDALRLWSPARYGQLKIPGEGNYGTFLAEAPAYEIWPQALRALRTPIGARPLGDLPLKHLIATGGSQSAGTLQVYYGLREMQDRLTDAYLLFIFTTGSANVTTADGTGVPVTYGNIQLGEVTGVPVLTISSETDTNTLQRPDGDNVVLWEIAGTVHSDQDQFDSNFLLRQRDLGIDIHAADKDCTAPPRSQIPFRHALNAGLDAVVRWLETGERPGDAPGFQYGPTGAPEYDARGNVLGGIRYAQHAVPTAENSRVNSGGSGLTCGLYGRHIPFDAATLRALYASHAGYVQQVRTVNDENLRMGWLTAADAAETLSAAQAAAVPPLP